MLRLEYAPEGRFEDRATQAIFYRDLPPCLFSQETDGRILTVRTEALELRYRLGTPFAPETLSVRLLIEPASIWHFGEDFEDLGGMAETLDKANGPIPVGRGVCSQNGFSVLDDSDSVPLEPDGNVGVRVPGCTDCYFFGYGFDYPGAVRDLYRLTGVPPLLPLIRPMYHTHPKCSGAYEVPNQYWFGSQLIAAPITQKNDPKTGTGATKVWLPKGYWFDFFSGLCYASRRGRKMQINRPISQMPVFAKAGAIVPMANYASGDNVLSNCPDMTVLVFPGSSNRFSLYEDAGEGNDYLSGAFAQTEMELNWSDSPVFTIRAAEGDRSLIPEVRTWRIGLRGFHSSAAVSLQVNGNFFQTQSRWEQDINTLWLTVTAATADEITVTVTGDPLITDNSDVPQRIDFLIQRAQYTMFEKQAILQHLADPKKKFPVRINYLTGGIMAGSLGDCIAELLTLTEDPYSGPEFPE